MIGKISPIINFLFRAWNPLPAPRRGAGEYFIFAWLLQIRAAIFARIHAKRLIITLSEHAQYNIIDIFSRLYSLYTFNAAFFAKNMVISLDF